VEDLETLEKPPFQKWWKKVVKLDKTASILSSMKNSVIIKMLSKADDNLYIGKHTGVDHENSHFQATVPHLIFSSV
jgi:hypothetical protein